jgi:hypothetical protein
MPLPTTAFLANWHDIDPAFEPEWHRWHTFEHMPERVSIPGFLAGRRYMNTNAARQTCFTMYEGRDVTVFNSSAYLERLNAPTEWTRAMAPAFRDFQRGACRCIASEGAGVGGAILAMRFDLSGTPMAAPPIDGGALIAYATAAEGVTAAHIAICDHEITQVNTKERAARSASGENPYDAVFLIEGIGHVELAAARETLVRRATKAFEGYTLDLAEIYDLAFVLREGDL